jgi:hypothetical protein
MIESPIDARLAHRLENAEAAAWLDFYAALPGTIGAQYRQLAQRGVEVLLVSPQSQDHSQSLATRFDAPMRFLSDPGNRAALALGILAEDGLAAAPTSLQSQFHRDRDQAGVQCPDRSLIHVVLSATCQ